MLMLQLFVTASARVSGVSAFAASYFAASRDAPCISYPTFTIEMSWLEPELFDIRDAE